jgi:hypothetical protein
LEDAKHGPHLAYFVLGWYCSACTVSASSILNRIKETTMQKPLHAALLLVLAGGVHTAQAATFDTTSATPNDGILQAFTGIDWNSNGGGWIQGFDLTAANIIGDTDDFTLTYQAFAGTIQTTSPTPNLYVSSPGSESGGYEATIYSTLSETATCLTSSCTVIDVTTTGGTWEIQFDTSPDADQAAGTGFTNGVTVLSGVWTGGNGIFSALGGPVGPGSSGTGSASVVGDVTFTNNTYVNPDLLGTTFQASLQFPGQSSPTYTRPAAFDGVATGPDTLTDFVLQVDGSQEFTVVPEPTTLALAGIGLLGAAAARRRRRKL